MNKVKDIDRGYRKAIKRLTDLDGAYVTLGIHAEDNDKVEGGATVADIAAIHEFGTRHVPERSFLRRTVDEKSAEWGELSKTLTGKVLDGKMSSKQAMGLLGAKAAGDVKKTITTLDTPANAPSTIAQKGSSNPLIDTGRLRGAISHEVKSK